MLIERKPEYHEKRNHETKTGDNREPLVKEQEIIKNTNSQNNEMKLREKKNTKITQPLLPYFRKEVMKMRKDPQFSGKDQKVEAVAAVLNDSAHCSNFGKFVGFEAKSRNITDENRIASLVIRKLQNYAYKPEPVWRAHAQMQIMEIAKEALAFSQQLPEQQGELNAEMIEDEVRKKVIDGKQHFTNAVFKQFRLSGLENSAESLTAVAFEELCHQLKWPMETLVNNEFVRQCIQDFAIDARTVFFRKERATVEENNQKSKDRKEIEAMALENRKEKTFRELIVKCETWRYRSNLVGTVADRVAARHLLPKETRKVLVEELNERWKEGTFEGVLPPHIEEVILKLVEDAEKEFECKFLNKKTESKEVEDNKRTGNEGTETTTPINTPVCKQRVLQSEKKIRISRSVDAIRRCNTYTGRGENSKTIEMKSANEDTSNTEHFNHEKNEVERLIENDNSITVTVEQTIEANSSKIIESEQREDTIVMTREEDREGGAELRTQEGSPISCSILAPTPLRRSKKLETPPHNR